jgi:outer membrane protein TolC
MSYFNFLLNRDLNATILKDTTIRSALSTTYKMGDLTAAALTHRQEIKQVEHGLLANEDLLALNRNSALLPKLSVVGDAGYQGFKYKFNDEQRYWLVQFNLTWDLFRGGERKAKTQQAKIDYKITENKMEQLKKQIELQVIQAFHELNAAKSAFLTSQSAVKRSEKFFQIVSAKYNEGQAIMLEYLDAENKLTTARMMEVINTYELLRREAALQKTIANL